MSIDHKTEAKKWFIKGDQDEKAARILIEHNGPAETACFLLQQWVEKYLKGYLAWQGQKPEKTHDLERLITICSQLDSDFSKWTNEVTLLNGYYIGSRYPLDLEVNFTPPEALRCAESIASAIKNKI